MTDLVISVASVQKTSTTEIVWGKLAGEAITAGKQVYLDDATNKWKLADNNSATAAVRVPTGTALNGCSDGQPLAVATGGELDFGAVFTAGVTYYLSDTAGGICPIADVGSGEDVVVIGVAKTTSRLSLIYRASGVTL